MNYNLGAQQDDKVINQSATLIFLSVMERLSPTFNVAKCQLLRQQVNWGPGHSMAHPCHLLKPKGSSGVATTFLVP